MLPEIIRSVETSELGISAGLQDRVVQVYGGLVHMDFTEDTVKALGTGLYTSLPVEILPPMYLAYNTSLGDRFLYERMRKQFQNDIGYQVGSRGKYIPP